jgi:hypothetical protein
MKIKIDAFAGTRPRVSSRLLGNEEATQAVNCRLYSGKLMGFREPIVIEEGEILTNLIVSQIGIDVVTFGTSMLVSQVGAEVITRRQPALNVTQVGIDVVSIVSP